MHAQAGPREQRSTRGSNPIGSRYEVEKQTCDTRQVDPYPVDIEWQFEQGWDIQAESSLVHPQTQTVFKEVPSNEGTLMIFDYNDYANLMTMLTF